MWPVWRVYAALMKSPRVNIHCILIIQVSGANSIRGWQAAFNDLFKMCRFFKSFFTYRHCSICQTMRLYTSVGALARRFSIQFSPLVLHPYYIELFHADTKLLEYLTMLDFLFPEFKFFRESFCLSNWGVLSHGKRNNIFQCSNISIFGMFHSVSKLVFSAHYCLHIGILYTRGELAHSSRPRFGQIDFTILGNTNKQSATLVMVISLDTGQSWGKSRKLPLAFFSIQLLPCLRHNCFS